MCVILHEDPEYFPLFLAEVEKNLDALGLLAQRYRSLDVEEAEHA